MPAAPARYVARDALGELWTEKRGRRVVTVRRLNLPPPIAEQVSRDTAAAAKLTHDNILRPLEVGESKNKLQIVYEMTEGRTLRALLTTLAATGEKLPVSQATWVIMEVLKALEHAHGRVDEKKRPVPVFHGRLSPEHVVLTKAGEVRVTGFGLEAAARHLLRDASKLDPAFAYVAPEQVRGEQLVAASDNFAAGCILAEALLGEALFLESNLSKTFDAILNRPLPVIRKRRDNVPLALDEALAWSLEKNPDQRCPRVDALLTRLSAFQGMIAVGDRIKPGEHAGRLADLIRLRMKDAAAPALDMTSLEAVDENTAPGLDEPIVTKVIANPLFRGGRRLLTVLRAVAVLSLAVLGVGIWAKWPQLRGPIEERLPEALVRYLRLAPATAAPALATPAAAAPDAGEPDAGEPDAGATQPRMAMLSIHTIPASAVSLDGKPVGRTPLESLEVAPGEHTLEFVSVRPRLKVSRRITLAEGEKKKLKLRLKRR
ncbi:MAG: protein kinase [Myxococcales bacterium]|nr:protein kinase [Myxococcales bacterium]